MSDEQNEQKPANGTARQPRPEAPAAKPPRPHLAETPAADEAEIDVAVGNIGADPAAVLAAEVETLQSQIADLTNRLLRAHADLDNLRKRSEREKQETARYAISKFARDTVEVADNFERAMQAVPAEALESNPALKALLEGVSMTEREFLNVLERHGVKRVSPKGEPFNPHMHQAVMERQDPTVANGTVLEVFQAGYVIEDRCLRPAMVVVARGGGKTDKPAATAKESAEPAADAAAARSGNGQTQEDKSGPDDGETAI